MKKLVLLLLLASGALYAVDRPEDEMPSAPPLSAFAASSSDSEPSAPPLSEDEEVQLALEESEEEAKKRAFDNEVEKRYLQDVIKESEKSAPQQGPLHFAGARQVSARRPTNTRNVPQGTFWSGVGKGCAMSAAAGALFVWADYALLATGRLIGETSAYRRTVDRPACYRWGLGLGGLSAGLSVIYDYCKGDLLKPFKCETAAEKLGMFTASVASFLTACFLLKK